jgi:hypothetical protein
MHLRATLWAALAIAVCVAATPRDNAVIINSGSTNAYGYTITVWSDGTASATLQDHGGAPAASPKPFTVPAATVARFFSDLGAARKGNLTSEPCMKSASFGSTMHVKWQGWMSPDLTCPPQGSLGQALVDDVNAIRKASGIPESAPRSAGPP